MWGLLRREKLGLIFLAIGLLLGVSLALPLRILFGLESLSAHGLGMGLGVTATMLFYFNMPGIRPKAPEPAPEPAPVPPAAPPDFFIINGVSAHDAVKTRRACRHAGTMTARDGTRLQLYRIDPPMSEDPPFPPEVMLDVIGLFQMVRMSQITADGVVPVPSGKADFWVIAQIEDQYVALGAIGTVEVVP